LPRHHTWKADFAVALFLFIVMTHRGNIARLIRGEEKKLEIKRMLQAPE
jgi:glycerol-3-phosphate acyltransferase PlsY